MMWAMVIGRKTAGNLELQFGKIKPTALVGFLLCYTYAYG